MADAQTQIQEAAARPSSVGADCLERVDYIIHYPPGLWGHDPRRAHYVMRQKTVNVVAFPRLFAPTGGGGSPPIFGRSRRGVGDGFPTITSAVAERAERLEPHECDRPFAIPLHVASVPTMTQTVARPRSTR